MFFFDVFDVERSKPLFSAHPSGVLRVRPVQVQRPTGHPVAPPGDEGPGSARRHQRSGQPHHGVAKTGTPPTPPTDRGVGRSALFGRLDIRASFAFI